MSAEVGEAVAAAVADAGHAISDAVSSGVEAASAAVESFTSSDEATEASAKKPLSDLKVGNEYQGVVNNVLSYGCFVDIGYVVNGLVHISQLADDYVTSTESIVQDGQTVTVKVLSVDEEAQKVVLTMRSSPRKAPQRAADVSEYAAILASDPGRFLEGTIESTVSYGAFVKLSDNCSGFLHISQLRPKTEHVADVTDVLAVGDTVQVRIRDVNEELKRVNLSLLPLGASNAASKDVSHLVDADKSAMRPGKISSVHDYGMFVTVDGVDGLVHISKIQQGSKLSSEELKERYTVGQEVNVRILAVDAENNKLSLSLLEPKPQADLSQFVAVAEDGSWIDGTVKSTTEYGAFVEIADGVDGMVHISELAEERLDAVTDAVAVGQTVKVRVLNVEQDKRKVRLSMRQPHAAGSEGSSSRSSGGGNRSRKSARGPKNIEKYAAMSEDEVVEGKVVSIMPFGAFVQLDENTDGLLHISQISDSRLDTVEDALTIGQTVQVRILEVDAEAGRIGVTMKSPGASDDSSSSYSGGGGRSRAKKDVSALAAYDPEAFVTGTVSSLLSYGAFVSIPAGSSTVEGLLHISAMSEDRVEDVADVLQEGQEVSVRIIDVDQGSGKVSLSMLAVGSAKDGAASSRRADREGGEDGEGDAFAPGAKKRGPRVHFADFDEAKGSRSGAASGETDWQKYLDQYYTGKKD